MKLKRGDAIKAWHWLPASYRLGYGDHHLAAAGYVYSVKGPVVLCEWGLHGSIGAVDSLRYARYPIISRVLLYGNVVTGDDKLVATHREVLWIANASDLLHDFARWCAWAVIDYWAVPIPDAICKYLDTGDPALRESVRKAARYLLPVAIINTQDPGALPRYVPVAEPICDAIMTDPCDAALFSARRHAGFVGRATTERELHARLCELGKSTTPNYED